MYNLIGMMGKIVSGLETAAGIRRPKLPDYREVLQSLFYAGEENRSPF